MSPATGQNPLAFVITNQGAELCTLKGYPAVSLLAANGDVLPFSISHRGDQMFTARRPAAVRVQPGRSAHFMLNKYRCDLGTLRSATALRVGPLDARRAGLRVSLRGPGAIGYCGKGDPGSTVTVSPVEPTLAALFQRT